MDNTQKRTFRFYWQVSDVVFPDVGDELSLLADNLAIELRGKFGRKGMVGGSSSTPTAATGTPTARGAELVGRIAKQLGYEGVVNVTDEAGREFTVGDVKFTCAGTYDPDTGEITIYDSYDLDEQEAQGLLAHEIQHAKWVEFRKNGGWAKTFLQVGSDPNLINKLKQSDGVIDYSIKYWSNRFTPDTYLAINETLAEIARLKVQGGDLSKVDPVWMELFDKVNNG